MKKRIIRLNREVFVNWYLDKDTLNGLQDDLYDGLLAGEFTITADELFGNLGYIPENLIINKKALSGFIIDGEIEHPSSMLKVMWVK